MTRYEYHGLVGEEKVGDSENFEYDTEDDDSGRMEEDDMPGFHNMYCPIKLGQVLQDRYQIVRKVHWSNTWTFWFCRDQKTNRYITLKVSTATSTKFDDHPVTRELRNYRYLQSINTTHPGRSFILPLLDTFDIPRSDGKLHRCMVHPSTVTWIRGHTDIKSDVYSALQALDFLHTANMTHCSINEVLRGVQDERVFDAIDPHDSHRPLVIKGYPVYYSEGVQIDKASYNLPTLSGLTQARVGSLDATTRDPIQGITIRAPEVVLQTRNYSHAIDIWNLGCYVCSWNFRWDRLFWPFDSETDDYSAYLHLAQMISLLGPPPRDLLAKSPFSTLLFNNARRLITPTELDIDAVEKALYAGRRGSTSDWGGTKIAGLAGTEREAYPPHPLPLRPLESLPCVIDKDEKDRDDFVDFVRRMLAWQPEQRDTAAELLQHPWLEELRHIGVYRKIYCSLPTYEGV